MATPQPALATWPIDLSQDASLRKSFDTLRGKWGEVPFTQFERAKSKDLLALSDQEVLETWTKAYVTSSTGEAFSARGWYQLLYKDIFRGKKVLDVGCGLGPDSVFFAEHGASVTFLDIIESNVEFVKRVCRVKGLTNTAFCHMEDLNSLSALPDDFDVITCYGSFHHAPLELVRMEAQVLLKHLSVGGRWIQLGYPKTRWQREGRMPFDRWGDKTDGGAPWAEWHDLDKLRYILAPANFDVILNLEFHNSDFSWFDLIRSAEPALAHGLAEPMLWGKDRTQDEMAVLQAQIEELQDQAITLQQAIESSRQDAARLGQEKRDLEAVWRAVQDSAGWRLLDKWRNVRNGLAPQDSFRRGLYDSVLGTLRRGETR